MLIKLQLELITVHRALRVKDRNQKVKHWDILDNMKEEEKKWQIKEPLYCIDMPIADLSFWKRNTNNRSPKGNMWSAIPVALLWGIVNWSEGKQGSGPEGDEVL